MKIQFKAAENSSCRVLKNDGAKIRMTEISAQTKRAKSTVCCITEDKSTSIRLFNKIIKHGADLCTFSEIIEDNVLKR